MRKPDRATRTAAGALLLFCGLRLLVRHERNHRVSAIRTIELRDKQASDLHELSARFTNSEAHVGRAGLAREFSFGSTRRRCRSRSSTPQSATKGQCHGGERRSE